MVREPTEAEYQASERSSDRLVGLWLLTLVGCACLSGAVAALTNRDADLVAPAIFVPRSARRRDSLRDQLAASAVTF